MPCICYLENLAQPQAQVVRSPSRVICRLLDCQFRRRNLFVSILVAAIGWYCILHYPNNADHSQNHPSSKPKVDTSSVLRWHGHGYSRSACFVFSSCTCEKPIARAQLTVRTARTIGTRCLQFIAIELPATKARLSIRIFIAYGPEGQLRFTIARLQALTPP